MVADVARFDLDRTTSGAAALKQCDFILLSTGLRRLHTVWVNLIDLWHTLTWFAIYRRACEKALADALPPNEFILVVCL